MAVANAVTGRRILVADDSSTIQKVIKIAFSRHSAEIVEAGSFIEALAAVSRATPDALILDASLPGAHGPADFAKLAEGASRAPVLLLVGTYEAVDEAEFRRAGFQHFLKKPFESADLVQLVDSLLAAGAPRGAGATTRPPQTTVIHPPGTFPDIDAPPRPMPGHVVPPPPPGMTNPGQTPPPFRGALDDALDLEGDDDAASASAPVPPPPMSDQGRKGRRAFAEDDQIDITRPPDAPAFSLDLGDDAETKPRGGAASEPSPLPTIPKGLGGLGGGAAGASLDLGLEDDQPAAPRLAPRHTLEPQPASIAAPAPAPAAAPAPDVDSLLPLIEEQLPGLVRQMVEAYCERNFKGLAREIIAAELRRLADEKARHLVDS